MREVLEMVAGKETALSPEGVAVLRGMNLHVCRYSLAEQQGPSKR